LNRIKLLIIGMMIVTYLPRLIPFLLASKIKFPKGLRSFLRFIPYTTLGALILPGIFSATPQMPIAAIAGGASGVFTLTLLGGGLILGAFFMATDYTTAPVSPVGQIVFVIGAGILTAVIRVKGGFPEGVSYSILLMNVVTPIIEKFTAPKIFGRVNK